MIRVHIGNIFESEMQTLVNTVNCVGVMGKGLALELKKRFPDMYEDYLIRCKAKQVHLGEPYLYRGLLPPWIINFPTKDHWRSVSRLSDIVAGLEYLEKHYSEWEISSLAVPALGCNNGQLEWRVVGPTLYRYLSRLDIPVELYAPYGTPTEEIDASFLSQNVVSASIESVPSEGWKINPAYIALVEILARIDREPYHWPVGRVTFQKIAYFATVLGLPTSLQFVRGSYGPFSSDLRQLTTRLVNNGLIQEVQIGKMFSVKPGSTYQDAVQAFRVQLAQWETIIDRISDLFLRMRTQEAEIAATVHFTAQTLAKLSQESVSEMTILEGVKRWKQKRTPPLKEEEVGQSIRDLNLLGWINAKLSSDLPIPQETLFF
ncbi:MAG TPA: macro domain-containing protein [Ktedonobacteraceae bacterium]|nr:macro domain-containing protein [Ktedonobacteraceae bacterium]